MLCQDARRVRVEGLIFASNMMKGRDVSSRGVAGAPR